MELHLKYGSRREVVGVAGSGAELLLSFDGAEPIRATIVDRGPTSLTLELGGQRERVRYWREGAVLHLHLRGEVVRLELEDPDRESGPDPGTASPVLRAPMPGKILEVLVNEGDRVQAGSPMVRMEAMKMEIDVTAPADGVVETVSVRAGDLVEPDAELVRLAAATGD